MQGKSAGVLQEPMLSELLLLGGLAFRAKGVTAMQVLWEPYFRVISTEPRFMHAISCDTTFFIEYAFLSLGW